jgi:hypothetical protein
MEKTFTFGRLTCTVLARLLAFAVVSSAFCQTPPVDKKLDEIEKQLQTLKQLMDDLRRAPQPGVASTDADAPPAGDAAATNRVAPDRRTNTNDPIVRIREEGLNRSQITQTLSYLTDVIGPRLTGSPNLKRANEWTRDKLASWGLTNAQLEAWGPFGRGWSLKRFSAQIVEPYNFPLIGHPKAWSPGFDEPLVANVIYLDAKTEADLDKYKGTLKGAIILTSPARQVNARFEPLARRMTETNLLRLANASEPRGAGASGRGRFGGNPGRRGGPPANAAEDASTPADPARAEAAASLGPGRRGGPGGGQFAFAGRVLSLSPGKALRWRLVPAPRVTAALCL